MRNYKIPEDKIAIIPGGVDLERFYPAAEKTEIKKRLNIPKEKMILLTVRNLVPRMGLENLLYAIQKVVKAAPDVYFIVGGEGPLKDRLLSLTGELRIVDNIKFTGFVPEAELPDHYRMADIFILPTLELEGF